MLSDLEKAEKIVYQLMYSKDRFSQWLGIDILEVMPGKCTLRAKIKPEMLNGFNICHGGITFAVADSAFAFASNSRGIQSLSVETSISHVKKVLPDDTIIAVAIEKHITSKFGHYEVLLTNQHNETVAIFKGTVFRTGKSWDIM
ncbi:MAG: hotdog fold thioesterase [Saprospiraceae bacterium]|nr:hotdog fold thioesterase [Saprospiraceae bacterium]MBP6446067.1 hotdog fold thioesterase [Saprospiraceae bacterium]